MRVNAYAEEITGEVDIIHKGPFAGIRFYLKSADSLHSTHLDDDRSAITFWIPNTEAAAIEVENAFGRARHLTKQFIETHGLPIKAPKRPEEVILSNSTSGSEQLRRENPDAPFPGNRRLPDTIND
jgi:hypothetical protein